MLDARQCVAVALAGVTCRWMPAQQTAPIAPWPDGLQSFAWLPDGLDTDEAALRALRELGVTGVTVGDGQDPEPARRLGLSIYRDQLVGKGTLELRDSQFAPLRAAYEQDRAIEHLLRPNCLSDPATQGDLLARALTALAPLAAAPPSFVILGDEVSTTRHVNPLDFSFSPHALAEFRTFLRGRYRDIGALNRAWQTSHASFDTVEPFTADRIRAREFAAGGTLPANLSPWAEHRAFMDRALARTVRSLAGCARAKVAVPIGLTGLQQPAAYGGSDYSLLMPELDVFEIYDIGGARDLAMSLARPLARQIITLFPPKEGQPMDLVAAHVTDALAHGMTGVVLWHAGHLLNRADGMQPTPFGVAVRDALRGAQSLSPLAGASVERSLVWIVESQPAVQAHWMLDSASDGVTWPRRLSSYEETHSTSVAARASWVRLCEDLGLQPRFVAAAQLRALLAQQQVKLLVLPVCLALSDEEIAAVTDYVQQGGVAVADGMLAFYDDRLRRRDRPGLDAVFGLTPRAVPGLAQLLVHEGQPAAQARLLSGAAACERSIEAAIAERAAPSLSVQCEHRFGRGTAIYLNIAVCEYASVRLDPKRLNAARDLRRRVQRVLDTADVAPPVSVRGKGLPTCLERMLLRHKSGRRFLALRVNAIDSPFVLQTLSTQSPLTVEVQFAAATRLRVLGESAWRGPSAHFELPLDAWRGVFAELDR